MTLSDREKADHATRLVRRPRRSVTVLIVLAGYAAVLALLIFIGDRFSLPDPDSALTPAGGAFAAAAHVLTGQDAPTDFLLDYASAQALRSGASPYEISSLLIERVGQTWPVQHANPHPPTILGLVLTFTFLPYDWALAAWSLAMACALVASLWLVGVRPTSALVVGVAIAITWPGAYGIGNVVPLIGLGVAMAWRWRRAPVPAGLGIALAAIPKVSGLILLAPFLVAARWKAVTWAIAFTAILALIPLALNGNVWRDYLDSGVEAINLNMARGDNASLLSRGIPSAVVTVVLGLLGVAAATRTGDAFWPTVWLMVAALPIAWMYSLLTLAPLLARSWSHPRARWLVVLCVAVAVGSSPLGAWPSVTFGLTVALAYLALWWTPEPDGLPLPWVRWRPSTAVTSDPR